MCCVCVRHFTCGVTWLGLQLPYPATLAAVAFSKKSSVKNAVLIGKSALSYHQPIKLRAVGAHSRCRIWATLDVRVAVGAQKLRMRDGDTMMVMINLDVLRGEINGVGHK